jgi:hypothetical protein
MRKPRWLWHFKNLWENDYKNPLKCKEVTEKLHIIKNRDKKNDYKEWANPNDLDILKTTYIVGSIFDEMDNALHKKNQWCSL